MFISPNPKIIDSKSLNQERTATIGFWQLARDDVYALGSTFRLREVLILLPVLAFIGLENSFWAGEFTQLIDEDEIGAVLAVLGVFEVVAGLLLGGVVKRSGVICWVLAGTVAFGCGLILVACFTREVGTSPKIAGTPLVTSALQMKSREMTICVCGR